MAVTSDIVEPFLEGMTLDQAIQKKKIYIADLEVLYGLTSHKENQVNITLCKSSYICIFKPSLKTGNG